jgi:glycosyltransferase involved in cell wall biosynthesis
MMGMSAHMNLLMLTHNYPRTPDDYAGVFISLLAKALVPLGLRPVIVAPHDGDLPEREETDGVRIYRFRYADSAEEQTLAYRGDMHRQALRLPGGPFRFRRFLNSFQSLALDVVQRENIDIIAAHWLVPGGIVLRRLLPHVSLPVVLYSHGTDVRLFTRFAPWSERYFRPLWSRLHRWVVVSSFLKEQISAVAPQVSEKIEVLPLPHNEKVFDRDESVKKESNLLVAVTRFTPQKRVDKLIRAFHWTVREEPSARLEVYGTGPLEGELRSLTTELGLDGQVMFYAPVSQRQLREIYNRASAVVLNSTGEGFGLALSEAMLCGTAVIGTASGGITDIVVDRERGLLVEPDNITALAEAMVSLLRNVPFRERLARHGYDYARDVFASAPLARRNAQLLTDALGRDQHG